jgi:hypothetical protein
MLTSPAYVLQRELGRCFRKLLHLDTAHISTTPVDSQMSNPNNLQLFYNIQIKTIPSFLDSLKPGSLSPGNALKTQTIHTRLVSTNS